MSSIGRASAGARSIELGRTAAAETSLSALARTDLWLLLVLVLVVVAYRVLTLPMIEACCDAAANWYYAKTWLAELGGGHIQNHRIARFAIPTLTAAFQSVFGTHLIVYYLPALSMSVAQVVLVYLLCRRAAGVLPAVFACLLVILYPQMVRNGAQLLPGVFCGTFVIAAIYMLSRNFDPPQGRIETNIAVAAILIFLAYMSKEPNLFFVPACLLAVWSARRSGRDLALFMGVLGALGLFEYLYYLLMVDGAWLGRLSTMTKHVRTMTTVENLPPDHVGLTWLNLPLRRYSPIRLGGIAPAVAFYSAGVCAIYLLLRERRADNTRALVAYAFLSYALIDLYAVTGVDPLTPAQKFHARYLAVLVPMIGLVIAFAAGDVGASLARRMQEVNGRRSGIVLAPAVTSALAMIFIYSFHDANRPHYVTNLAEHPFAVLQNYQAVVDDARAHCVPFVVQPGKARTMTNLLFADRFHPLKWKGLERSDFEAVAFPQDCASRYANLRAYVDAVGRDGEVTAVLVSVQHPRYGRRLFIERQRLPIERLLPEA